MLHVVLHNYCFSVVPKIVRHMSTCALTTSTAVHLYVPAISRQKPILLWIFPWAPAPSDFHGRSSCGFSHGRQRPRISMSNPVADFPMGASALGFPCPIQMRKRKQSMILLKHKMWVRFLSSIFHLLSDTRSVGDPLLCFIQWETCCNAICFISTYLTNSGALKSNWWPFAHGSIFWHHQIFTVFSPSKNVLRRSLLNLFNAHSNER